MGAGWEWVLTDLLLIARRRVFKRAACRPLARSTFTVKPRDPSLSTMIPERRTKPATYAAALSTPVVWTPKTPKDQAESPYQGTVPESRHESSSND